MTTASDPSWGGTFPGGVDAASRPKQPSTAGVWIGVVILVAGLIGAGIWFFTGILGLTRRINDLPRFTVPGQTTVSLEPGTYHLYAEYFDADSDPGPASAMSPIVVTDSRGEPIPVSASTEFTYRYGTHVGRSAGEFTVSESGLYTVSAQLDSTSFETIDVAIARNGIIDASSIIGSVFGSIALGAVATLVGVILIIVTLVRRNRWRRQFQPRAGPPWTGGGPGYVQPGYIPPGYGPPGYTPPGYGPQGYPGAGYPAPGYGQPPPPGPGQVPAASPWATPAPPPPGSGPPPWEQPTTSPWDAPSPAPPDPGSTAPWNPPGPAGGDAPGWAAPGGPAVAPPPRWPAPAAAPGAEPEADTSAPGGAGLGGPPGGSGGQDDDTTAPGSAGLGAGGLGGAGLATGSSGPATSAPGGAGLGGSGLGAAGIGGSTAPGGAGLEGPSDAGAAPARPTVPPRRGLAPGEMPPGWGPPPGSTADEGSGDSDESDDLDPGSGDSP